jgi:hypothetical protein
MRLQAFRPNQVFKAITSTFQPTDLFRNGEQGLWYDLNDDSTIFQDSAGTTLATWGDPVGRVNDKSGNGNNAVQGSAGLRPQRGRMPKRGAVNALVNSQGFAGAGWAGREATIASSLVLSPDGVSTAQRLVPNTNSTSHGVGRTLSVVSGTTYTYSVYAKAAEYSQVSISRGGTGGFAATGVYVFDLITGTIPVAPSAGTASIIAVGDGWYRCSYTAPAIATLSASDYLAVYAGSGGSLTLVGNASDAVLIWGAQFEAASSATAYQKVGATAFDITESGQPSCGYLSFNGTNQSMQTAAAVNFTATDEMSVFAGFTRSGAEAASNLSLIDALTTTTNGRINISSPTSTASDSVASAYRSGTSSGGQTVSVAGTMPQGSTRVVTSLAKVATPSIIQRVNGMQVGTNTSSFGTGNFANIVLYFGSQGGSSRFFNGLMFSIIIRGALTSGALLTRTEQYVARQTPTVNL